MGKGKEMEDCSHLMITIIVNEYGIISTRDVYRGHVILTGCVSPSS